MKYIKKFEDIYLSDSKYKVGDYVISTDSGNKGIIYQVSYYYNTFLYSIIGYFGIYNAEKDLILMTPEEIEQYKIEKLTDKFNI